MRSVTSRLPSVLRRSSSSLSRARPAVVISVSFISRRPCSRRLASAAMGSQAHLRNWGLAPMADSSVRRNSVRTMYGTIVCGITETPEARAAAQLAAALAERLGLRLVLVHVSFGHGTERTLGELASRLGDHVEARIVSGRNRADGLASVAADEGADVIVLGSRPRGA